MVFMPVCQASCAPVENAQPLRPTAHAGEDLRETGGKPATGAGTPLAIGRGVDKLTIRAFMTPSPHTIGADQPLRVALEVMNAHRIRHLPVLRDGDLVGLLSKRDLEVALALPGVDPATVEVEEAMIPDPFAISPDSSLEWIAMEMAEHKYGSTVVVDGKKVVGVFTTVDALRALQEALGRSRRRRKHTPVPRRA
jgi:acetoin utilization protein AcuB